jgi:hypothetical protein
LISIILPIEVWARLNDRAQEAGFLNTDGTPNPGALFDQQVDRLSAMLGRELGPADIEEICEWVDPDLQTLGRVMSRMALGAAAIPVPICAGVHYCLPSIERAGGAWHTVSLR